MKYLKNFDSIEGANGYEADLPFIGTIKKIENNSLLGGEKRICLPTKIEETNDSSFIKWDNSYAITYKSDGSSAITLYEDNILTIMNDKKITKCIIGNDITTISAHCFWLNNELYEVTIPDSITTIEYGAFQGCSSLTSITIPDSVVEMVGFCFSGCTSLSSITLSNNILNLQDCTFESCISLKYILMPSLVNEIGSDVFSGCTNLETIDFSNYKNTTPPTLNNINSFNGLPENYKIIVPYNLYYNWINATNWNNIKNHIIYINSE